MKNEFNKYNKRDFIVSAALDKGMDAIATTKGPEN